MKFAIFACRAAVALGFAAFSASIAAEPADGGLPRRSFWGIIPAEEAGKLVINRVVPGATAAAVGFKSGDAVLSVNGKAIVKPVDFGAALRSVSPGSAVTVTVLRSHMTIALHGRAVAAPRETYDNASVTYGAVPFADGALRSIMVEPAGESSSAPVVFMMQGFSCASIEALQPGGEFDELARGFAKAGIAFFRVEKPGLGDSSGSLRCADIDLPTELQAFRAGYRKLIQSGYDPSRIIILGHSLGGIEAPVLASETPPRGVIVYGTVLRNWADYTQDLDRVQDFMATGDDPAAEYDRSERDRPAIQEFFFKNRPIADIVRDHPGLKDNVTALFSWDGGTKAYGRNEEFDRGISRIDLPTAWRGTRSYVLSLYGATDIIALTGEDQRMIADLVNHYRPGTAEYIEIPNTMHLMDLVGDRETYRRANEAAGKLTDGPFNPQVISVMVAWIKSIIGKPLVASGA